MSSTPTLDQHFVVPSVEGLDGRRDDELLALQRHYAAVRRLVDAGAARIAAAVERRSGRELGQSGLAQREGAPTAARLIEVVAGVSPGEAHTMVTVGAMLEAAGQPGTAYLDEVVGAVASGQLSLAAAQAIRDGLGAPTATVDETALTGAATRLVAVAPEVPVRRLAADARALRDSLDTAGIAEREEAMRQRRYLRFSPQNDGMTRVNGLLDPESAAIVVAAFDQVSAPRRGGPRFVDPAAVERARRIVDDPRTTDQLVADAFVDMIRIAGAADAGKVFAQKRPAVQIHVGLAEFQAGTGEAHIEGQTVAVSVATAQRMACSSGAVPILFGVDGPLDVGRTQRTFTERQRVALSARDFGCRWRGCYRPASWTEAHHADEWERDQGPTDCENGILLCRFHHMRVHNLGWRIIRRGGEFFASPPAGTGGAEIPLPSRNPIRVKRR
ncbi:MAG: DUF222 domain-containing protein [Pseudolysinimonas sp.]